MLSYVVVVVDIVVYAQKATIFLLPSRGRLACMHGKPVVFCKTTLTPQPLRRKVETHLSVWMKRSCARAPYYTQLSSRKIALYAN
jgi:hypothetical protein